MEVNCTLKATSVDGQDQKCSPQHITAHLYKMDRPDGTQ